MSETLPPDPAPLSDPHPEATPAKPGAARRTLAMLSLILAGEAVFVPIYHLNRYFKSSFEAVFQINASQIGDLFFWFGGVSMASYLLGGPIADRFSPRVLLAGSLLLTGAGGLYMATIPGFKALQCLFAFWGASSILGFWAPLMRATREWGGQLAQGRAFGLLDGGRGLLSAVIASLATLLFASTLGDGQDPASQAAAVRAVLWFYAACCLAAAAGVWLCLPRSPSPAPPGGGGTANPPGGGATRGALLHRLTTVARLPAVWLQTVILFTAYASFRGFDNYGDYAEKAFGLDATQSASLAAGLSYLRAVAALGAGWVADRWLGVSRTIALGFVTLIACFALLIATPTTAAFYYLAVANMAVSAVAFFGLRGIYFALFEETRVPRAATGTAVGLISFIGFTPDTFFAKLHGWLVTVPEAQAAQMSPEAIAAAQLTGYQTLFTVLLALSAVGLAAAWLLGRLAARATRVPDE